MANSVLNKAKPSSGRTGTWFHNLSIRVKLSLAFLLVSILSAGGVGIIADQTIQRELLDKAGSDVRATSAGVSRLLSDVLEQEIKLLNAFSENTIIEQSVHDFTEVEYASSDPAEIVTTLKAIDEQWVVADDQSDLIRSALDNPAAIELREIREQFPENSELFITDKYGALVAATNRTSDFYQADEEWWQEAYDNGNGDVYIGDPEFDESSNVYGVNFALPIFDDARESEIIGILRATYSLESLVSLVAEIESEQDVAGTHTDLVLGEQLFAVDTGELEAFDIEPFHQFANRPYLEFEFAGVPSLIAVSSMDGNPTSMAPISDLNWLVIAHIDRELALAPANAQRQTTLFASLLVLIVASVIGFIVSQFLSQPLIHLTETAQQIAEGNLSQRAEVTSEDEIGVLAFVFNSMAERLSRYFSDLESQVAGRTKQLETLVEVGQKLSAILDLSELMQQVVILTRETFDYYHVHIYLLTENQETLLMAQGYGEAGAEMKRNAHSIPLAAAKSLVARAARERSLVSVPNVFEDQDWLHNPLLPETRSEMAVPILLGDEVVGVLDVQSDRVNGLTDDDVVTLTALANQIATAVRNARLFAETQESLYKTQRLQRIYIGQAWEQIVRKKRTNYEVRASEAVAPLTDSEPPEAVSALQTGETIKQMGRQKTNGSQANGHQTPESPTQAIATPLKLRNQIIGVLGVQNTDPGRSWSKDEIALIEAISEQMSLALENARLFEETQRNAWRDRLVSESTAKVWSSDEIEEVMRSAVTQLGDKLNAAEVIIQLNPNHDISE